MPAVPSNAYRSPEEAYALKPNIIIPATHPYSLADTIARAAQHAELSDDVDGGSGPQLAVTRSTATNTYTYDADIASGQALRKEGEAQ